jgi:hypothetical protein
VNCDDRVAHGKDVIETLAIFVGVANPNSSLHRRGTSATFRRYVFCVGRDASYQFGIGLRPTNAHEALYSANIALY